jgi:hypothetical protein
VGVDVYALSLPRGHGFGDHPPEGAWQSDDGIACGVVTRNVNEVSTQFDRLGQQPVAGYSPEPVGADDASYTLRLRRSVIRSQGLVQQADHGPAIKWLFQKSEGAGGLGALSDALLGKCRDENDRQATSLGEQMALKLQPIHARHLHIGASVHWLCLGVE